MKKYALPLRIGVIGCGNISNAYFTHTAPFGKYVHITSCADLDLNRAKAKASEHGVAKSYVVKDLLQDEEIDAVLNLTVPQAHVEVNLAALKAGKHVYCEKPFSLHSREGVRVLAEAKKRGLYVGCAPDTVLGGGIQTCRKLIDDGAIGRPIAATANMVCHGHESWHPNPEFYYKAGGGPLFDMGPYYITSLIMMMGPVRKVSGQAATSFATRTITSQPLNGKKIKVETPTHITGALEFASGALATITMSFDVWQHHLPLLEVHGTEGSLSCPDPNTFGGEVLLWNKGGKKWKKIGLTHSGKTGRGFGLADMAFAIQKKQANRMNGEMALHVVEIMESLLASGRTGRAITLKSTCRQPQAIPAGLPLGVVR